MLNLLTYCVDGIHIYLTDDTIVTAKACLVESANVCCLPAWDVQVSIKRCTDSNAVYFVYQLQAPPGCPTGYCAGDGEVCPIGTEYIPAIGSCSKQINCSDI